MNGFGIVREFVPRGPPNDVLELGDDRLEIRRIEFGVARDTTGLSLRSENLLDGQVPSGIGQLAHSPFCALLG